ncbi:MAG: hypothetical protein HUK22_01485 [Thermoguttaceae bacterium]|nr:hypothetical protein [Thermoguttaceae bacterium]
MKHALLFSTVLAALLGAFAPIFAQTAPKPVESSLETVGFFKNGVVVVREKIDVPGPGSYALPEPPAALHGTFFIQSDAIVETTSTTAEIEVPISEAGTIDWATDFVGRIVSLVVADEERKVAVERAIPVQTEVSVQPDPYASSFVAAPRAAVGGASVLLRDVESGETIWLSPNEVAQIGTIKFHDGAPTTVKREKAALVFDVAAKLGAEAAPTTIWISYLTRGAAWAPQYRVELRDEKTLSIEQSAVIVNDWRSIAGAAASLFSGYPQIEMQNVLSPLAPNVALTTFLNALNSQNSRSRSENFSTSQMMTSNMAINVRDAGASVPASPDEREGGASGVDVFAQQIGALTIEKNARKELTIARKSAPYRRVVCWNIGDIRGLDGRPYAANRYDSEMNASSVYGRTTSGEPSFANSNRFEEPWDALEFNNPFDFPITTGPASVLSGTKFLGQNLVFWTNPGEKTLLPVTKALSVRVKSIENERDAETYKPQGDANPAFDHKLAPDAWGMRVVKNGVPYRVAAIDAQITLENNRAEETTVLLARQFSGVPAPQTFEGFDSAPECATIGSADFRRDGRNLRRELRWATVLKPGEKRTLKFTYQTLIQE